jgi:spore coat protein JB
LSRNEANESYRLGRLPGELAPLAMSYVPMQTSSAPNYEAGDALARGTLFPGLDLPFMNLVNSELPNTPMAELMAIDFVADELELYLDTHASDGDAFELYQSMLALRREARERYTARYGVICQKDMLGMDAYCWLRDPWPWEYPGRRER